VRDEVDDVDLVVERAAALDLGKAALEVCVGPHEQRPGRRMQELRGYRTTTAQLLAMVGWLRLWRVQRVVMESAKQDGIPDTKSAVTPDLLEDA
jgi:transposase